jgi:acyl-coenzyme A synthetase/AMP-(fatty) acid ligase
VRLWNFYGQTEIAPLATVLKPEDQLRKPGSAGKPVINVETRVVDDDMHDVAPGGGAQCLAPRSGFACAADSRSSVLSSL